MPEDNKKKKRVHKRKPKDPKMFQTIKVTSIAVSDATWADDILGLRFNDVDLVFAMHHSVAKTLAKALFARTEGMSTEEAKVYLTTDPH